MMSSGFCLFLMSVGTLFAVLGLLTGRAATVGTGDILLFLGLGLHLVLLLARPSAPSEVDTILQYLLEVTLLTHIMIYLISPPLGRGWGWV